MIDLKSRKILTAGIASEAEGEAFSKQGIVPDDFALSESFTATCWHDEASYRGLSLSRVRQLPLFHLS